MKELKNCEKLGFHKMKWKKDYVNMHCTKFENSGYYITLFTKFENSSIKIYPRLRCVGEEWKRWKDVEQTKISFEESLKIMDLFYRK